MTSRVQFSVTFDGPALERHEMDARDLAGALFALGDFCSAAGKVLYGESAKVEVKVKASFQESSFKIDFALIHSWLSALIDMLNGNDAVAAATALSFLGALGFLPNGGLIGLLRKLKGRKITSIEENNQTKVIIILSDGERWEEERNIVELYRDIHTRKELAKILNPLEKEGINEFRVGQDGHTMSISKEEISYFRYVPGDESLNEVEYEMKFEVVSPVFQKGLKWKLSDGTSTFYAEILDDLFWEEIEKGQQSFSMGDILKCRARMVQILQEERLKSSYQIIKVHDHIKSPKPQKLPFKESE